MCFRFTLVSMGFLFAWFLCSMISNDYSIVIRPQCATAEPCEGDVRFTKPIVFNNLPNINITTAAYYSDIPIVAEVCPLFTFVGARVVSITNVKIQCLSTSNTDTAPAILFEKSADLDLTLDTVSATGWVLSTVLVLGGNFDVVPPTSSTAMSGTAKAVGVSKSVYSDAVSITISDYTGTLNVSEMDKYSRLIIAPDVGGNLTIGTNMYLDVTDASELTNIFGRPYETEFNTDGDMYGYTRDTIDGTAKQLLAWLSVAFIVLVGLALVMYQNVLARYQTYKRLESEEG